MLDEELQRTAIEFYSKPVPHLLYCTSYQDAVSPPFPDDGKRGLSIYVGKLRQFRQPEVALLWALEKKRGRARVVVVTDLRGKDFIPAYRELGSCLGDPHLAPLNFLRRRKDKWDTLDFFSCGRSLRGEPFAVLGSARERAPARGCSLAAIGEIKIGGE